MDPYNSGPGYGSIMGQVQASKLDGLKRERMLANQDLKRARAIVSNLESKIASIDAEIELSEGKLTPSVTLPKKARKTTTPSRNRGKKTAKAQ